MDRHLLEIAAGVMKVPVEEAAQHCRPVPELDAYYFWNPVRGGIAVIVASNGEKLGAGSAVSFEKHVQAFRDGRRN